MMPSLAIKKELFSEINKKNDVIVMSIVSRVVSCILNICLLHNILIHNS